MITPITPINIPATEAKVADGLWISSLNIVAPSVTGKVRMVANIVPFVSSTGELLSKQSKLLKIDDIMALAQTNTTVSNAMASLFAAIQGQVTAQNLF